MVYHYTSGKAIPSILKMKDRKIHLWFTRYDCLNDSSEGDELFNIIKLVAEKYMLNKQISPCLWDTIKDKYNATIDGAVFFIDKGKDEKGRLISSTFSSKYKAYICSFSRKPDLVDMWRYYSKGDVGYSLGLEDALFEQEIKNCYDDKSDNSPIYKPIFEDVIYDDTKKEQIIDSCFQECFNFKKSDSSDEAFASNLCNLVSKYRFIFKHNCFLNEEEIRCVIYIPEDAKLLNKKGAKTFSIDYRERNGEIIPYIELVFPSTVLFTVMLSPLASDNSLRLMKEYYDDFFRDRKAAEKAVKKSELPLRF